MARLVGFRLCMCSCLPCHENTPQGSVSILLLWQFRTGTFSSKTLKMAQTHLQWKWKKNYFIEKQKQDVIALYLKGYNVEMTTYPLTVFETFNPYQFNPGIYYKCIFSCH